MQFNVILRVQHNDQLDGSDDPIVQYASVFIEDWQ